MNGRPPSPRIGTPGEPWGSLLRARGSAGLWALWLPIALLGCAEPLTEAECVRMLDRYTELLIRSDRANAKAAEREKLKAEARAKASRDPEFQRCPEAVSRRQYECAIDAPDVDGMERCLL